MYLQKNIKLFVKRFSNIHQAGLKPDIFIFSTARSGSTYLIELLHTQAGMKFCSEPLNVRKPLIRSAIGINGWEDLLPGPDRELKLKRYFTAIRNNRIPYVNQYPFRRSYRFKTNRMVFKIIHGGEDLIHWFRKTFGAQILYLIRHPIAVTLSRKVYPRLTYFLQNKNYRKLLNAEHIALSETIIRSGSDFEKGILSWCLQNYPPLKNPDRMNWATVSYEELVMNPEPVINHLAKCIDLPNPKKILLKIDRPSSTVYKSDEKTKVFFKQASTQEERFWLVSKWKNKVTEKQEELAFKILEAFKIDAYTFGKFLPSQNCLISKSNEIQ